MEMRLERKDEFTVYGVRRSFSCDKKENHTGIPAMWGECLSNGTVRALEEANDGAVRGVLGICVEAPRADDPSAIEYWIAAHSHAAPPNCEELRIPGGEYAVFPIIGPMPTAMQQAWQAIFSVALPSSGYTVVGGPQVEWYDDGDPQSVDYRSEVWVPVTAAV